MPGVTTAYQTGIHSARPAASSGCILFSCTTHGLVYRSDGTTWTTFLTLPGGSVAGTPALTFGTSAATGAAATFIATDATLPIFDATVPTTQAFSDAAAAGSAGAAARRDHKHGMPASPGGSAGGLVLIESHTAAASTTLDFTTRNAAGQSGATIQSDADEYLIEVVGLLPANNNVTFDCQVSTDGGSTWDSTAGHYHSRNFTMGGGSGMDTEATTSFGLSYSGANITNDAAHGGLRGSLRYFKAATGSAYPAMMGQTTWWDGTQNSGALPSCSYLTAGAAVNALRFKFGAGNITSGIIRMYLLQK